MSRCTRAALFQLNFSPFATKKIADNICNHRDVTHSAGIRFPPRYTMITGCHVSSDSGVGDFPTQVVELVSRLV